MCCVRVIGGGVIFCIHATADGEYTSVSSFNDMTEGLVGTAQVYALYNASVYK